MSTYTNGPSVGVSSGGASITLANQNWTTSGSGGVLTSDTNGNLVWSGGSGASCLNVSLSKQNFEQILKEFATGKYTLRYVQIYLEFMVLNAVIDNLEYLEYKQLLSKE